LPPYPAATRIVSRHSSQRKFSQSVSCQFQFESLSPLLDKTRLATHHRAMVRAIEPVFQQNIASIQHRNFYGSDSPMSTSFLWVSSAEYPMVDRFASIRYLGDIHFRQQYPAGHVQFQQSTQYVSSHQTQSPLLPFPMPASFFPHPGLRGE